MIALCVFTDGRDDYLRRTLESFEDKVDGPLISARILHDDTGDPDHARNLSETYPGFAVVATPERAGFDGAIRSAWSLLPDLAPAAKLVLHVEDDFVFKRDVDLAAMAGVLDRHPEIVHVALRRQAWNDEEKAAGGVCEVYPEGYEDVEEDGQHWLEHRMFWTTNPSLYRMSLLTVGWPEGAQSEGRFGLKLRKVGTPEAHAHHIKFAFWGRRTDEPWLEHIGTERVGTGY